MFPYDNGQNDEPYVVTFGVTEAEYLYDLLHKVRELMSFSGDDTVPTELDDLLDALDNADSIQFVEDEEAE